MGRGEYSNVMSTIKRVVKSANKPKATPPTKLPDADIVSRLRKLSDDIAEEAADEILRLRQRVLAERERAEAAERRAVGSSLVVRAEGGKGLGEPK